MFNFILSCSDTTQNELNHVFPHTVHFDNADEAKCLKWLKYSLSHDYVFCELAKNKATQLTNGNVEYRNIRENWNGSNIFLVDIDDGLSLADFIEKYGKYQMVISTSRNHQKAKNGLTCDRYHVLFIASKKYDNIDEYISVYKQIVASIPQADKAVKDPTRLIFGNPNTEITIIDNDYPCYDTLFTTKQEAGFTTSTTSDGQQIITPSVANQQKFENAENQPKKKAGRHKKSTEPTEAEVRDMLSYLSADCDYQTWLEIGMGLSSAGFGYLWHEWSKTSTMYNEAECDAKLESFKRDNDTNAITIATVIAYAKNAGYYLGKVAKKYISSGKDVDVDDTLFEGEEALMPDHVSFEEGMDILAFMVREKMCYIREYKKFYVATKTRWQEADNELLSFYKSYVRALGKLMDKLSNKQVEKLYNLVANKPFASIEREMQTRLGVFAKEFDKEPNVLNCCGVVYDLSGDEIKTHNFSYKDKLLKYIPVKPSTDPEQMRIWNDFLLSTLDNPEVILEKQKLYGLGFANLDIVRPIQLLNGTGGNGKSTEINVISRVLGKDEFGACRTISSKYLMVNNNEPYAGANMKGSNICVFNEMPFGRLDIDILKQICSKDTMSTRDIYKETVFFVPYQANVASTNKLPTVKDIDVAILDRIRIFDYPHSFRGKKGCKANLESKLVATCAGAVLQWIFDGAMLAKKDAEQYGEILKSEKTKEIMKQYEQNNSWQLRLIDELGIVLDKNGRIDRDEFYNKYCDYCELTGDKHPLDLNRFVIDINQKLGTKSLTVRRGKGGRISEHYLVGIAYSDDTPTGTDDTTSKGNASTSATTCKSDILTSTAPKVAVAESATFDIPATEPTSTAIASATEAEVPAKVEDTPKAPAKAEAKGFCTVSYAVSDVSDDADNEDNDNEDNDNDADNEVSAEMIHELHNQLDESEDDTFFTMPSIEQQEATVKQVEQTINNKQKEMVMDIKQEAPTTPANSNEPHHFTSKGKQKDPNYEHEFWEAKRAEAMRKSEELADKQRVQAFSSPHFETDREHDPQYDAWCKEQGIGDDLPF